MKTFKVKFVEFIPPKEEMEELTLYISREYETANHICPCGCGEQVPIPITEDKRAVGGPRNPWHLIIHDEKTVTLSPSLQNQCCRCHYFIQKNDLICLSS